MWRNNKEACNFLGDCTGSMQICDLQGFKEQRKIGKRRRSILRNTLRYLKIRSTFPRILKRMTDAFSTKSFLAIEQE
jgi:hypothetical protein